MSEEALTSEQGKTDESGVIKELRAKANQLDSVKAELEQAKSQAATELLNNRGYSEEMAALFVNQVEGFPTAEKVDEFLGSLGLTANEPEAPAPDPVTPVDDRASSLGQSVAAAASGATPSMPEQLLGDLDKAQSSAEVIAIMENARASS